MIPDTTTDARLTGMEQFLEFWLGPRKPEYGIPPDILAQAELPLPLQRFYAFAGRWPPARSPYSPNRFSAQDTFLTADPGTAQIYPDGPYLVFLAENQSVWVASTLPLGEDPGVWISVDGSHGWGNTRWRALEHPLSHFLVSLVLQETLFRTEYGGASENALTLFQEAECQIEPLWLNGEYAWEDTRHSYYLIDQRILLRQDTGDVSLDEQWYGFDDPEAIPLFESLGLPYTF